MKQYTLLVSFALICLFSANASGVFNNEVKTLDGNTIVLSEAIKGQFIVLDFWPIWSKPCLFSIPKVIQLSEKYDNSQVQFVGVNVDSPKENDEKSHGVIPIDIPYTVIYDSTRAVLSELLVDAYPTLIILNKEGQVLYTHVGFSLGDEVEIEEFIDNLLVDL